MPKIVFLGGNSGNIKGLSDFIDLSWTASVSAGVTQYRIYRSLVTGGSYLRIASISSSLTTYRDVNLLVSTTYYYVVTAFDGTNESVHSNEASATTWA